MQEVFNKYINYLEAERNASRYTVRNYTHDLLDFFNFLKSKKIASLNEVDKHVVRDYLSHLAPRIQALRQRQEQLQTATWEIETILADRRVELAVADSLKISRFVMEDTLKSILGAQRRPVESRMKIKLKKSMGQL